MIKDETLRQLGTELKRDARQRKATVNDAFVIELRNYARHELVKRLNEPDTRIVLETIAKKALENYQALDSLSVWKTIQKLCRPQTTWDLCAGAARNILVGAGRTKSAERLDTLRSQLLAEWKLDE